MQDINKSRVELKDRQTQTPEIYSRFEPLVLRSRLHLKEFLLSPERNSTQDTILYTRGEHLANGPLHKRRAQSQYTSIQEGITKQKKMTSPDHH